MEDKGKCKVWVVEVGSRYEGYSIVGILSCENKAKELKSKCEERLSGMEEADVFSYYIDEVVDFYKRYYKL